MDPRGLITEDNRKWWTLGAMCLSMFMIMLDSTVVNVALPSIQKDLDTTVDQLEWVVNGYTLSFAALLVTGGRLGDIFGSRRIFMIGVAVFALSSATAGLAQSPTMLVVLRIAEGVGGALMMPATLRPDVAAISMSGSSVIVALNAVALKRLRLPEAPRSPDLMPSHGSISH